MISRTWGGVLALAFTLSIGAHAQWLNYREPGLPRTPDGKADLRAPAPMDPTGKPDLSGVWMHETTTPAEMKRLYGSVIDDEIQVGVPGMQIGTQLNTAVTSSSTSNREKRRCVRKLSSECAGTRPGLS